MEQKELMGKVKGYSHEGMGVIRQENTVFFVPGTLAEEEVRFFVPSFAGKKGPVFGELQEIVTPSSHRTAPFCPCYDACGGCQLQHAAYPYQLEIKGQILARALRPLAGFEPGLAAMQKPVLASPEKTGYRNKGIFAIERRQGRALLGFYQRKSREIAGLGCPGLFSREVNGLLSALAVWLDNRPDILLGPAGLHHLLVRESKTTGQLILVLIASGPKPAWLSDFLKLFIPKAPQDLPPCAPPPRQILSGIGWLSSPSQDGPVLRGKPETLWGSLVLAEELRGLKFGIPPQAFFQINTRQTEFLYEKVLELAGLTGRETVWDLYSGIGTISLCLAQRARRVLGIEYEAEAVKAAQTNAAINKLENTEFLAGPAEKLLPAYQGPAAHPDTVVLDPPAKGAAGPVLSAILSAVPRRIVYVSCDPPTLARDLQKLLASGAYRLETIEPVDMFPQTAHVETVVLMSRVKD